MRSQRTQGNDRKEGRTHNQNRETWPGKGEEVKEVDRQGQGQIKGNDGRMKGARRWGKSGVRIGGGRGGLGKERFFQFLQKNKQTGMNPYLGCLTSGAPDLEGKNRKKE